MIQTLKRYLLMAATAAMLFTPTIGTTAVVSAAAGCSGITNSVATGANAAVPGGVSTNIDCTSTNVNNAGIKVLAARITNTFSIIVGAASIIMIIYGGFRYVTSGGESGRVGAAKNALLYAVVGLVVVALAQLIVHFVLNQATQLTG